MGISAYLIIQTGHKTELHLLLQSLLQPYGILVCDSKKTPEINSFCLEKKEIKYHREETLFIYLFILSCPFHFVFVNHMK